jgi:hypothetical protein
VRGVAVDENGNILCRFTGRKGQRAGCRFVIIIGDFGCAVGCLIVDSDGLIACGRKRNGENIIRRAAVAFVGGRI